MTLHLGSESPNFNADTTIGPINFYEWLGDSWGILFSHPANFTPVCTTELGAVANLSNEFEKRNVKTIGLSVDKIDSHKDWIQDIEETQNVKVAFPIIADADKAVATLYDMIHDETDDKLTVRSVFVIDPNKKIRLTLTYPPSAGRSFNEILRVIDSLQLTSYNQVATPADWNHGDEVVILPTLSNEEAKEKFPQGWDEKKPYLRLTKI
jgi:alkyl hydroperoxide reductase subunit AhpC|tara:strand:+ start:1586 stop:2212 length:627 start_codon:yes stop_codon:yes gene_type:complete